MAIRRKYSAEVIGHLSPDGVATAQMHPAHIASLREARAHHRAINLELRSYFDSVAAETVPDEFRNLLGTDEESA